MVRPCVHIALLLLLCVNGFAQTTRIDSLYASVKTAKDSRAKARLLHLIVASTWDYDLEKGYAAAKQEYEFAREQGDPEDLMISLTDMGMYHYFTGEYDEADRLYREALAAARGKNFGEYPAYTYTRLGNLHRVRGEFDSASRYYQKTLESLKGTPKGIAEGSVYFHIGWLEVDLSRYAAALPPLRKSLAIRNALGDSLLIAECWRVFGMAHLGLNQYDSASYYLKKVKGVGERFHDNELIILVSINLADLHFAQGDLLGSIREYQRALVMLQSHDFKRYRALVLHHIGLVFDSQGNYLKSIEYLLNALKLSEEMNNRQEIARIHVAIGWTYNNLHNYEQAFTFASKALAICRGTGDLATIAYAQNLMGNIHFNRKQYDLTLRYYDSALTYRTNLDLTLLMSNTMYNIALCYEARGLHDEALRYLLHDLEITEKALNVRGQILASSAIGLIYGRKGNLSNAEYYLNHSLALANLNGAPIDRRDIYYNFAQVYSKSGQPQKAIRYYDRYIEVNDSVVNRESQQSALQMGALYELDKKESELEKLTSENALKQAQIDVQRTDLRMKNVVLFFSSIALALLAVAGVVLYRYYREKSSSHKALVKLNREINEQKEEIQAQSEELVEANESLSNLNYNLLEKQEEIEAQTEELREANETIGEINVGLENVINKRTAQLKEAYKELDTFFYRSSHDFRRPLTTFLGLAEVAKITVKDANALELFEKVKETATNLDKMLFKLQSISDVGTQQLMYKEVFIKEIVATIRDSFRDEITNAGMKVICEVNLQDAFYSYPAMIKLIIENLVENAIHFRRPDGPVVSVKAIQKDRHVMLEVSDNGQGIDPQFHEQIFEMYFRASERSKGNGLGLYIVKKALEKMEGTITLKSFPAQGSTFIVYLPLENHVLKTH